MLTTGDSAPLDISILDENGVARTLREYAGSWVVVYFYPKDNTPGCTLEAEGFRDMQSAFKKFNTYIVGVSKDTCASHQKFIGKKKLTFTLISDSEHALMEAFGTWGKRSFMGKTYMGTSRSTFLLDPKGTVAHVWEKVKPLGHPDEVLAVVRGLQQT
jgi:thioredoxin-dependent peroxiredoxin